MGTWGTGIQDNDTASEVYSDYISLLKTYSIEITRQKITSHYQSKINSYEESNHYWLALAAAQLDTNTLQTDVVERVTTLIETGADLALWKELKASEQDLETRKAALNAFLTQVKESFQSRRIT